MGGRKKKGRRKLKLVGPPDGRCRATTKAGKRCRRKAVKNGACEIKAHQDQARGLTVGRRSPAKHEAQCKACSHPELARVSEEWTLGALADADAAKALGCSKRAWQRHAAYRGLYDERARTSILPYLSQVMDHALKGEPTLAAGVAAARLAHNIVSGGEKIIIEAMEAAKPQLFEALDKARKLPLETDLNGLISFLLAELGAGDDDEDEKTVH